ncbi:tRNA (adenosine(37)-N6)-threonylcarbamoyltransferase complex ATPase subunit type 1 TsaE [Alteromonas pelagimontana]|uniref:tRNA threonylcarbamoyladenosine biosynthesis protein TsaE n=1 Tax=Alteromonas pelagimontana TaxID=1858656 RepID=A0A6M4MDW6_9ALTE|nr:tRNA (adenosine(37)-N6)-threonylcarbamoyltransferase complex ATPase subunit type 1 TsaE [Alteromonas pelagimontana]QJR81381.1 tRNA (adenosine(37)-N6)-threonylcarbamoyltransferase complex ATPase subunit type 1 TsaE [Alteromonas pelagimontana]
MSYPQSSFFAASPEDTARLAEDLSSALTQLLPAGVVIFLEGELGAGKTTFSRYFIQSLGHTGNVKSPTYTLVEPYELEGVVVYHFDLYRLSDPEELEYMGVRDYFRDNAICLVEWPEKGGQSLAKADLVISISSMREGRRFTIEALSTKGTKLLQLCKRV